jgi:hypothetical protein
LYEKEIQDDKKIVIIFYIKSREGETETERERESKKGERVFMIKTERDNSQKRTEEEI